MEEIKMGLFDRFNRNNSNYIVPDGGDFIIYCEYSTELKNNLNNELIEYFYKKWEKYCSQY